MLGSHNSLLVLQLSLQWKLALFWNLVLLLKLLDMSSMNDVLDNYRLNPCMLDSLLLLLLHHCSCLLVLQSL